MMFPTFRRMGRAWKRSFRKGWEKTWHRRWFKRKLRQTLKRFLQEQMDQRQKQELWKYITSATEGILQTLGRAPVSNSPPEHRDVSDFRERMQMLLDQVMQEMAAYLHEHVFSLMSPRRSITVFLDQDLQLRVGTPNGDSLEEHIQQFFVPVYSSESAQRIAYVSRLYTEYRWSPRFTYIPLTPLRGLPAAVRTLVWSLIFCAILFVVMKVAPHVHYRVYAWFPGWIDRSFLGGVQFVGGSATLLSAAVYFSHQLRALWRRLTLNPWVEAILMALLENLFGNMLILGENRMVGWSYVVVGIALFLLTCALLTTDGVWSRWLRSSWRGRFLAFGTGLSLLALFRWFWEVRGLGHDLSTFLLSISPLGVLMIINTVKVRIFGKDFDVVGRILAWRVYASPAVLRLKTFQEVLPPLALLRESEETWIREEVAFFVRWTNEILEDFQREVRYFFHVVGYIIHEEGSRNRR